VRPKRHRVSDPATLLSETSSDNSRPSRYQLTATALVSFHGHHDGPAAHRPPETVTLFFPSDATTGPHKANADIQCACACITSNSSFRPKQRLDLTRPTQTFSARVRVTTSNSSFRPKQRLDLTRSTRTFPCVCVTPQLHNKVMQETSRNHLQS
jgi:hypothetical protein